MVGMEIFIVIGATTTALNLMTLDKIYKELIGVLAMVDLVMVMAAGVACGATPAPVAP